MTKIKPMTLERIKEKVEFLSWPTIEGNPAAEHTFIASLILAWVEAEARARRSEYINRLSMHPKNGPKLYWKLSNYRAEVLCEIGWPEF